MEPAERTRVSRSLAASGELEDDLWWILSFLHWERAGVWIRSVLHGLLCLNTWSPAGGIVLGWYWTPEGSQLMKGSQWGMGSAGFCPLSLLHLCWGSVINQLLAAPTGPCCSLPGWHYHSGKLSQNEPTLLEVAFGMVFYDRNRRVTDTARDGSTFPKAGGSQKATIRMDLIATIYR